MEETGHVEMQQETGRTVCGLEVHQPSDDAEKFNIEGSSIRDKMDKEKESRISSVSHVHGCSDDINAQTTNSGMEQNQKRESERDSISDEPIEEKMIEEINSDAEMMIDVIPCRSLEKLAARDVYSVNRRIRGRAVIISNRYFLRGDPRDGAEHDESNLQRLFTALQFDTVVHRNFTAEKIKTCLEEERLDEKHYKADMFVLFILTHGSEGSIQGVDNNEMKIETITEMFDGKHCPALNNKPKIFFIQACQGDQVTAADNTVMSRERTVGDRSDAVDSDTEQCMETNNRKLEALHLDSILDSIFVHEKADTLISYATVQGYRAWRRSDKGSWFVRCIVYVFCKWAHDDHLSDLLTKVNNILSYLETIGTRRKYRQIAEKKDTLRKKLYFFPGYDGFKLRHD
jgi:hypothetical protein